MGYSQFSPVNTFRLRLSGGQTFECTSSLQDTLAFEREQKRPLVGSSGSVPLTTDLLWIAWHAACRENKTDLRQFAQFAARVEVFEARDREPTDFEFDDDLSFEDEQIAAVIGERPTHADQSNG